MNDVSEPGGEAPPPPGDRMAYAHFLFVEARRLIADVAPKDMREKLDALVSQSADLLRRPL